MTKVRVICPSMHPGSCRCFSSITENSMNTLSCPAASLLISLSLPNTDESVSSTKFIIDFLNSPLFEVKLKPVLTPLMLRYDRLARLLVRLLKRLKLILLFVLPELMILPVLMILAALCMLDYGTLR